MNVIDKIEFYLKEDIQKLNSSGVILKILLRKSRTFQMDCKNAKKRYIHSNKFHAS